MENIQVGIRLRPLSKKELQKGEENIWNITHNNTITLLPNFYKDLPSAKKLNLNSRISFTFDYTFSADQTNQAIYNTMVKRIALSSLNGINGTIFVYGQTGSGKTYTMMGYKQDEIDGYCFAKDFKLNNNNENSPIIRSKGLTPRTPTKINDKISYDNSASDQGIEILERPNFLYNENNNSGSIGIIIHALKDIFNTIENDMDKTYFLRCSYIEIYNDQVYDLLKNHHDKLSEALTVNEDMNKDFYIKGIIEEPVSNMQEIIDKLRKGEANRHYAATILNHASSRSHTIFRLYVQTASNNFIKSYRKQYINKKPNINNDALITQLRLSTVEKNNISARNLNDLDQIDKEDNNKQYKEHQEEETIITESLLNFVDLAGSEKISNNHHILLEENVFKDFPGSDRIYHEKDILSKTANIKERVKEGQHINKSLFFLTQVISLKSEGKSSQYLPYRNSPLTKILRSSLGGNSRTLIILCITPAGSQLEQTISTLRFGMNAKKIENKVQANIITNSQDEAIKMLISDHGKKLGDFRNSHHDYQSRYHDLIRQIDDLRTEKVRLLQRLDHIAKSQLMKVVENIPQCELNEFFEEVQQNWIHFDKVGLLFNSNALKKYDKQARAKLSNPNSDDDTQNNNPIGSSTKNPIKFPGLVENIIETNDKKPNNERGLIYDSQGKYALLAFKSIKKQNTILIKKIQALEDNQKQIINKYLQKYSIALDSSNKADKLGKKLIEYANEYCHELDTCANLKREIDLYKNLAGIHNLTDLELMELEHHFYNKIDQIKSERALRQYKSEINNLRTQLNMSMLHRRESERIQEENSLKKERVKLMLAQQGLLLSSTVPFDHMADQDYQNHKALELQNEEESIWKNFQNIIDPINQELAEIVRVVDDYDTNIMIIPKGEFESKPNTANKTEIRSKIIQKFSFGLDLGSTITEYNFERNNEFLKKDEKNNMRDSNGNINDANSNIKDVKNNTKDAKSNTNESLKPSDKSSGYLKGIKSNSPRVDKENHTPGGFLILDRTKIPRVGTEPNCNSARRVDFIPNDISFIKRESNTVCWLKDHVNKATKFDDKKSKTQVITRSTNNTRRRRSYSKENMESESTPAKKQPGKYGSLKQISLNDCNLKKKKMPSKAEINLIKPLNLIPFSYNKQGSIINTKYRSKTPKLSRTQKISDHTQYRHHQSPMMTGRSAIPLGQSATALGQLGLALSQSPLASSQSPLTLGQSPLASSQSPLASCESPLTSYQSSKVTHHSRRKDIDIGKIKGIGSTKITKDRSQETSNGNDNINIQGIWSMPHTSRTVDDKPEYKSLTSKQISKQNEDFGFECSFQRTGINFNIPEIDTIDRDETFFSNSIFSLKLGDKNESIEIDLIKNTNDHYTMSNNEWCVSPKQDEIIECPQPQINIEQEFRKRRTRAERAAKNKL